MYVCSFMVYFFFGVKYLGIFVVICEKIFYFKELGVNVVELMFIYEFDEFENFWFSFIIGEMFYNYWGYSIVGFFVFKVGYVVIGKLGM